jgi:hypothetical protein
MTTVVHDYRCAPNPNLYAYMTTMVHGGRNEIGNSGLLTTNCRTPIDALDPR